MYDCSIPMDKISLVFLFVFLLPYSECLRCLSCNGVLWPLLCNRIKQCADDEVCLTEKYITANSEDLYNVGCFSKNSCFNTTIGHQNSSNPYFSSHLSPDDKLQCAVCCDQDACNQRSCDQSQGDFNRGPLCFSCYQARDPALCSFVRSCETNQVCRTEEMTFSGLTFYTSSCSANSNCHGHIGTAFGRRKRSTYSNIKCCNNDLCNNNEIAAGASSKSTPPKTTPVTTIATTIHNIQYPIDCLDVKHNDQLRGSGVYTIYPDGKSQHKVFCDMVTDGGGWTVLSFRNDSIRTDWSRNWAAYKDGFGDTAGNYWIGNEYIYLLTVNRSMELYVKLQAHNSLWHYARYGNFSVGPESDNYRIHYDNSSYTGNAGNGFWDHGNEVMQGLPFTTKDRDNDNDNFRHNCASSFGGGWWFRDCFNAALTVQRSYKWQSDLTSATLKASYMMIRNKLHN